MDQLLSHAAVLELAARDMLVPVCGFGVAWCVIGAEALLALAVLAVCTVVGRFTRRNWQAVVFVLAILAAAAMVGLVGGLR